jgi:hypothetical protein
MRLDQKISTKKYDGCKYENAQAIKKGPEGPFSNLRKEAKPPVGKI